MNLRTSCVLIISLYVTVAVKHAQALQIREDKKAKGSNDNPLSRSLNTSETLEAFQKALQKHGLLGGGASNSSSEFADEVSRSLDSNSSSATSMQAAAAQRHVDDAALPASSLQAAAARTSVHANASTKCLGGYTPGEAGILDCPEGFADSQVQRLSGWFGFARVVLIFWVGVFALMSALLVEILRRVRSKSNPGQNVYDLLKEASAEILSEVWAVTVHHVAIQDLHKDSGAGVMAFLAEDHKKKFDASTPASGSGDGGNCMKSKDKTFVEKPWSPPMDEKQLVANLQGSAPAKNRSDGLLHHLALRFVLWPWRQLCCRRREAQPKLSQ